jgi:hypothetical protein
MEVFQFADRQKLLAALVAPFSPEHVRAMLERVR